jgi:predicted CXXCH cytochrome family protein
VHGPNALGIEKDALRQRGFAGINVCADSDVSYASQVPDQSRTSFLKSKVSKESYQICQEGPWNPPRFGVRSALASKQAADSRRKGFREAMNKLSALFTLVAFALQPGFAAGGPQTSSEYVGSQACMGCHASKYESWKKTGHATMLVEVINSTKLPLDIAKAPVQLRPELRKATYMVAGMFFLARDPATQHFKTLGAIYDRVEGAYKPITQIFDWSTECAGCHVTNMDTPALTWSEAGVGCEACHGPGRDHVVSKGDPKKVVVTKAADGCGQCHAGNDRLTGAHLMADGTKWVVGYRPGMKLSDVPGIQVTPVDPAKLPPDPEVNHLRIYNMWEASKHGKSLSHVIDEKRAGPECYGCHSAEGFAARREYKTIDIAGKASFHSLTCVTCHDSHENAVPHQLVMPGEKLCASCHANETIAPGKPAAAGKPVSTPNDAVLKGYGATGIAETEDVHSRIGCINCHMKEGNHLMKVIRPDDPSLAATRADSCLASCHKNKEKKDLIAGLQQWQAAYTKAMDPLQADMKALFSALKAKPDSLTPDLKLKLGAAMTNLSMLSGDKSRGAHNFKYAEKILGKARADLDAVKAGATDSTD